MWAGADERVALLEVRRDRHEPVEMVKVVKVEAGAGQIRGKLLKETFEYI